MMDPRRLIDDGADDFERALLAAGRRDALPASNRTRILVALGLTALMPGTAVAATAKGAMKGTLFGLAAGTGAKVAVGGALGAILVWSSVSLLREEAKPVVEARPVIVHQAPVREPAPAEPPAEVSPAEEEPDLAPVKAAPAGRGQSGTANDLGRELASLDEARAALRGGEPERSLRLLDEHARKFPRQSLRLEATVLRIEALSSSGRSEAARRAGNDFLAKHPNGPYAQRVRSLIGSDRAKAD